MGLQAPTRLSRLVLSSAVALALAGAGCAYTLTPAPSAELQPYRVGAPDELVVTILPEPVVLEKPIVRPDGMITIQLVGDVPAAGRTTDEIASDIEERISRYKRGARATVALSKAESSAVTVFGEVRTPMSFPLLKQTRVAEALGKVGGPTSFAKLDSIQVVRPAQTGTVVYPVDLAAIRSGDLATNLVVEGGDIIYVPPTLLAKIGYAMQQLLFPIQPLLGVAQATAGTALAHP
jgi:polysaccharide export outer membrane protein